MNKHVTCPLSIMDSLIDNVEWRVLDLLKSNNEALADDRLTDKDLSLFDYIDSSFIAGDCHVY